MHSHVIKVRECNFLALWDLARRIGVLHKLQNENSSVMKLILNKAFRYNIIHEIILNICFLQKYFFSSIKSLGKVKLALLLTKSVTPSLVNLKFSNFFFMNNYNRHRLVLSLISLTLLKSQRIFSHRNLLKRSFIAPFYVVL